MNASHQCEACCFNFIEEYGNFWHQNLSEKGSKNNVEVVDSLKTTIPLCWRLVSSTWLLGLQFSRLQKLYLYVITRTFGYGYMYDISMCWSYIHGWYNKHMATSAVAIVKPMLPWWKRDNFQVINRGVGSQCSVSMYYQLRSVSVCDNDCFRGWTISAW